MGWSMRRRSMPMTQKPKVASSLGMNFSGAMACTSCSARATSAEKMYLRPPISCIQGFRAVGLRV